MITNSAGLSGAKPTTMLTMPRLMSFCVVGLLVALDEVGLARRLALEGALPEQVLHECADVEADLAIRKLAAES